MSDPEPDNLRETMLQEHRTGVLLDKLFGSYAYRSDAAYTATIEALVDLHNQREINLLALLDTGIPEGEGTDFFLGMSLYCDLIPRLEAPVEKLMPVVLALVSAGGEDLAANQPFAAFRAWCVAHPSQIDDVLKLAARGFANAEALLSFALEAGALTDPDQYIDTTIDIVRDGEGERQLAAVVALSRIRFKESDERAELAADALNTAMTSRGDQKFQLNALRTAFDLAMKAPGTSQTAYRLLERQDKFDPHVVHLCAQLLGFSADSMSPMLLDILLSCVGNLDASNKGTIDKLDFGLRQLWVRGETERVIRTLEGLLRRHGKALKLSQFDSLAYEMLRRDRTALENMIVSWFLDGEFALCDNIANIVGRPDSNQLEFEIDFSRFRLPDIAWRYLGRKAVGFFILYPKTAASFLISLLRSAPQPEREGLVDLLFDPILLNYYGRAREYCERIKSDPADPAAALVAEALARQEQYLDGLRSVGEVRELHPSERQRRAEWRRHSDAMNTAYKAAEERSIFSKIAQRKVLLYGNRSIDYFQAPNEEPRRAEMELKRFSTSVEVPRVEIVDPVGLQYQLLVYRSERLNL